jgi:alpha-L-arabinofuranosidase
MRLKSLIVTILFALAKGVLAQDATITVQANHVLHPVSRYLTGACIEDVNHEVYGGIYSQMIFGESFAEPAPQQPLKGFSLYGGDWALMDDGSVQVEGGQGSKIIWDDPPFSEGEASVDVWLTESNGGNAGLILKVSNAGNGADVFNGYEISLERPGVLVIGRHRQNWEPLRRIPCDVPINQWITLTVRMTANTLEVLVNIKSIAKYQDSEHPLVTGQIGLRTWQQDVRFRNFSVTTGGVQRKIPFEFDSAKNGDAGVSGMWRPFRHGTADGQFSIDHQNAFSGHQSQKFIFTGGDGEIGIENQGLNRWGMNFVKDKTYEGHIWVRADTATQLFVALESRDESTIYAEQLLRAQAGDWQRLDFTLKPTESDCGGRFAIKLKQPGTVQVGFAFLEPGAWGRFAGLPVRKDVADGLIHQGITVLRYGGSMVNAADYRWKHMVGPRDFRPPYKGTWYPYSSDGWGIPDFLNFCEAAGFLGVPDFNINETPQDMADFVQYANAPSNTMWGAKRMADGHPEPYNLKYLELGNEERVDNTYYQKFQAIAQAIWAVDSNITLVVGDFAYSRVITDPFNFTGAASGITTLATQQQIVNLAHLNHRKVWFDVHVWDDGPTVDPSQAAMFSYDDALAKIADAADYKVLVFELNANHANQGRALGNALAINAAERDGRLPIVTSANCLQPDGENDNGWDQGLLFLNPSQVWLQPPGYVTRMYSDHYQPLEIQSSVTDPASHLDVATERSEDGSRMVLKAVNPDSQSALTEIIVRGHGRYKSAIVNELAGNLDQRNSADSPNRICPLEKTWMPNFKHGKTAYTFAPESVTVIEFRK